MGITIQSIKNTHEGGELVDIVFTLKCIYAHQLNTLIYQWCKKRGSYQCKLVDIAISNK